MITFIDFCIKVLKILKDYQIDCKELSSLIEQVMDEMDYTAPELEDVHMKKLIFYREECQALNQLRVKLQENIKGLKSELTTQKQINQELNSVITNQANEILNLKSQTIPVIPQLIKEKPKIKMNQYHHQETCLQIQIKNIRTPLYEVSQPTDLRSLFEDCVKTLYRDIQCKHTRKCRDAYNQRDHLGELRLSEEERDVQLTRLDTRTLTEKFLLNPHFLRMVEAQIFNLKCCDNINCLYNFKKLEQALQAPQKNETRTASKASTFRGQSRNHSFSVGKSDDVKLHYQQVFAEVVQLERELITTPRIEKARIQDLSQRLKRAKGQLQQLQCY